jgi:hypothetical protein
MNEGGVKGWEGGRDGLFVDILVEPSRAAGPRAPLLHLGRAVGEMAAGAAAEGWRGWCGRAWR